MFLSDYPRGLVNVLRLWSFPALDAFPVAPALAIAFPLAGRGCPVSLLRLPSCPLPRLFPAAFTAISLVRFLRPKPLFTFFQQTTTRTRLGRQTLPAAAPFFFGMTDRGDGRSPDPQKILQSDYNNSRLDVAVV